MLLRAEKLNEVIGRIDSHLAKIVVYGNRKSFNFLMDLIQEAYGGKLRALTNMKQTFGED